MQPVLPALAQKVRLLLLTLLWLFAGAAGMKAQTALDASNQGASRSFQLLLRTPDDVSVLGLPSWWTASRLGALAGGLAMVAAIAGGWVFSLRRQVQLKTTEILNLNRDLEQRIAERTTELQSVNSELEAFTYTVSHDLKSPVRLMQGMLQVLAEDHGQELSDEAKQLMNRAEANARKMTRLIEDLLAFSRANTTTLAVETIDVGSVVRSVFEELSAATPERKVRFVEKTILPAYADRALLKQAIENLLSNALKYTRPRSEAVIEAGSEAQGEQNLYYVKDNGIGFDMKNAPRLFAVFERLHHDDEFEGTGAGLAIVRRLIGRHHGRIWAEAVPGQGTTFYFTLPSLAAPPAMAVKPAQVPAETKMSVQPALAS